MQYVCSDCNGADKLVACERCEDDICERCVYINKDGLILCQTCYAMEQTNS